MLTLLGCNHTSAPVAVRERLAFAADDVAAAVERLCGRPGVREAYLLSTCNRVELLVRTTGCPGEDPIALLRGFLIDERGVSDAELAAHTYHHRGEAAARHLFEVAAGLDSMILGEPQIHGQVKVALADARRGGGIGKVLGRLFQQCLATTKRVRTETGIGRHAVSVAYAAASLAGQIFGDLAGRRVLLVGAGKMAQLVARHLVGGGVEQVVVCSRTYNSAATVASTFDGLAVPWDELSERLEAVDVVVCCTGAPHAVLDRELVAGVARRRRGLPLLVVDIAVPRDVDPAVGSIDGVYLYDIDGLQEIVDSSLEERRRAAADARAAIERDVRGFLRWRREQDLTPAILALRGRFEHVAREHLSRYGTRVGRHGGLDERGAAELERLVRALVRKLLHGPLVELRRAAAEGRADEVLSLYERIFDLPTDGARRRTDVGAERPTAVPAEGRLVGGDVVRAAERRGSGIRGVLRGGRID